MAVNIIDILSRLKLYLQQEYHDVFWIDPKHAPYGNLLIKNLITKKSIIFKSFETTQPIGGKRIQDFINNTPIFKKILIDNYVFVARRFKENAIELTKTQKELTLISIDFGNKNARIYTSSGVDKGIIKAIYEFSNNFEYIVGGADNQIIKNAIKGLPKPKNLINTEYTHRDGEDEMYFVCPLCGVNLSVPDEYRKYDELTCFNCHGTFKSPIFHPNDETDYSKLNLVQDKSTIDNRSITHDSLWLSKKRTNWILLIGTITLILGVLFWRVLAIINEENAPVFDKQEIKRPEIIYSKIKEAFSKKNYGICLDLFEEMKKNYPNSLLFDSIRKIYDNAIYKVQLENKESQSRKKTIKVNKKNQIKHVANNRFLKVFAQAYPDGVLSCNVYLIDNNDSIHFLDAKSIIYSIFDYNNFKIRATDKISISNTNYGLFIDIPLGTNVFKAKTISFIIKTAQGETYTSKNISIDY